MLPSRALRSPDGRSKGKVFVWRNTICCGEVQIGDNCANYFYGVKVKSL